MKKIILDGHSLSFDKIAAIANGASISLAEEAMAKVMRSFTYIQKISNGKKPIYGINTGFGYFANRKINTNQLKQLQVNLLRSHASGYGTPLSIPETRLAMALRLNVLLKGMTGVSWELCLALQQLINHHIYPLVPEYGSVGASGDLAPLAHLSLPLIGEGFVNYRGRVMPSSEALEKTGLKSYQLKEKEGLSLINGTQIMLALGSLAFIEAETLLTQAESITALSYEGLVGNTEALHPALHQARGQTGQCVSAQTILNHLTGSYLFQSKTKRLRIQDPYSLRCAPQVHGATRDALAYVKTILSNELNAATDNPLVFPDTHEIISGGNFHGQYLALAYDSAAMAIAELGNISERRLELLLNPHLSGLPAFLSPDEGIHSGYMAIQYLSASLVNENKLLANPSCTDSIPGNAGIEDHVSMGMTSARKFKKLVANARTILAIEMVAAAQAVDLRKIKTLGKGSGRLYEKIRKTIPFLDRDRMISEDVRLAVTLLEKL